jgi:hypothetical protein
LGKNLGHVRHITIDGDVKAQRNSFQYFQLNQTYLGKDSRLNIGPKGLLVKNMADLPIGIKPPFRFTWQPKTK